MKTTRELLVPLAQMLSTSGKPRVSNKFMMLTKITLQLNSDSRFSVLAKIRHLGLLRLILAE